MTPEASIALVESFWEEVWAAGNPAAIDRFVTDDFIITTAGADVAGRDDFKTWVADFQSKIADLKIETVETFANPDGSRVSSRWRVTGRNNGMFGLPADGKPSRSPATPSWPSRPPANSPTTGSNAAPGSSTISSRRRSTTAVNSLDEKRDNRADASCIDRNTSLPVGSVPRRR